MFHFSFNSKYFNELIQPPPFAVFCSEIFWMLTFYFDSRIRMLLSFHAQTRKSLLIMFQPGWSSDLEWWLRISTKDFQLEARKRLMLPWSPVGRVCLHAGWHEDPSSWAHCHMHCYKTSASHVNSSTFPTASMQIAGCWIGHKFRSCHLMR